MSEVPLQGSGVRVPENLGRVASVEELRYKLISHKVFLKSFCKSQFPHKSVNLFFILVIVMDKKGQKRSPGRCRFER